MDAYRYLAVMAACVALTLPLEWVLRARVYRRPRRLAPTLLLVLVVFTAWDTVAIARGHWHYSERYTTGLRLGPVPVEELVFFLVVPLCALLTYEGVGTALDRLGRLRHEWRVGRTGGAAPSSPPTVDD